MAVLVTKAEYELDPIECVGKEERFCAWQTAAILLSHGMGMARAAEQAAKLREMVDDSLRAAYRKANGLGDNENVKTV